MFRRIVFTAALAGLIAGLFLFSVQSFRVIPFILEAETYESASTTNPLPTYHPPETSGGGDYQLVWDAKRGKKLLKFGRNGAFKAVFSPDRKLIAATAGSSIKLYSTETSNEVRTLRGHNGEKSPAQATHSCGALLRARSLLQKAGRSCCERHRASGAVLWHHS